jgi:hypothetical protein
MPAVAPKITIELKTDAEETLQAIDEVESLSDLALEVVAYVMSKRSHAKVHGSKAPTQMVIRVGENAEYIDLTGLQPPEIRDKIRNMTRAQFQV